MKHPLFLANRPTLSAVAAVALLLVHTGASALSLGRLSVQSSLGEPLRAEVDITSISPDEAATLRANLASPEGFRAAGVEFNAALVGAKVALAKRDDGRSVIRITGDRSMAEPFVDMVLDLVWSGGKLQRSYTLLIDPPSRVNEAPSPVLTSPALSAAPVVVTPLPPVASAPLSRVSPPATAAPSPVEATVPKAPAKPKSKVEPKAPAVPKDVQSPSASSAENYRVRQGDTLSAIASRHSQSGVSLDQMLVSLYRGNPQAFTGNNMNRLKAGVVLNLPDADASAEVTQPEARQVIQAHSADFAAFRQQLAQSVPSVPVKESPRQAKGKLEAAVEDRKVTAAPATPDKLTLSRGSVAASAAEAKLSKEAERKAAAARMAELARNVDELKKLSDKPATPVAPNLAKPSTPAPVAPPAAPVLPPVATVSSGMTVPSSKPTLPVVPPAAAPASVPTLPKPTLLASAPVPTQPEPSASAPAVAPTAPTASAASVPPPPVSVVASAPVAPASAAASSVLAAAPAAPTGVSEPTFLESLTNNDYVLPVAVGVVALLAGLGLMRLRRRSQEGSETSFLESKLQPDSFFGVSGGQRVDTRDGANSAASSSLSYSLSQLDAIGDVDPVAEADVYLAYGRDLQAEEILKEALRTDPNRSAIRLKLLEVYAKRADVAGFESQALLLRDSIGESGDDWPEAQELGRSIDAGNPLYGHQGGAAVDLDTSRGSADLRDPAPTQPATDFIPVEEPAARLSDDMDIDLDIDLDTPPENTGLEATRPADPDMMLGLDTSASKPAPAAAIDTKPGDLPDLDLTMDLPDAPASVAPAPDSGFDFGDISLDLDPVQEEAAATPSQLPDAPQAPEVSEGDEADDPLARKLELADEFRRIGDIEGAKDLLDEVIAQASGPMKARAQTMLGELG
ncbi:MAG: FimV/HubP family polar landmark protein [Ideonella sp.]|nr:FimV/HubP family polar landmark protein [Ideonella sp.]